MTPRDTQPRTPPLAVTSVRGRYPSRPKALKPENIDVMVLETCPGVLVIRLDDRTADDFWLQLTIELRGET